MEAGFHQMQTQGLAEGRADARGAKCIGHERAASGTQFHEMARRGAAYLMPDLTAPQSDHLSEHLAYFRRGDEIAGGAEGIAALVIAMDRVAQRLGHELGNRHGSGEGDPAKKKLRQGRHGSRRRANQMKARPKASMGSDRSWPMV